MSKPAPETEKRFSLPRALAWTLLPLVAYLAAAYVTLPGLDMTQVPDRWSTLQNISIVALGVTPIFSGSLLVELFVLAFPSLALLRHGGPEGRRKLGRASTVLAYGFAAFQAMGIARMLDALSLAIHPGLAMELMIVVTLTASTAGLLLLTELASARGLASGVAVLVAVLPLVSALAKIPSWLIGGQSPLALVALFVQAAAVVIATWFVLERRGAPASSDRAVTYREPGAAGEEPAVILPAPASGIAPAAVTLFLFALGPEVRTLLKPDVYAMAMPPLVVVLAVILAWFFNAPARVAAVLARAREGGPSEADLEDEARAQLRPAMVEAAAYALLIFLLNEAVNKLVRMNIPSVCVALVTAIVLDARAEQRARVAQPDLVPVWPELRSYAVGAAREALGAAGIPVFARGERLHRLLQFFGPFAPIDLMVPRASAEEAAKLLEEVLGARQEAPGAEKPRRTREPRPVPVSRPALAALAGLVLASFALGATSLKPAKRSRPVRTTVLEFVEVDDERELITEGVRLTPPENLPKGLTFHAENVPLGPGKTALRWVPRMLRGEHESIDEVRRRLLTWAATLTLPEGDRVTTEDTYEYNEDTSSFELVGARAHLLRGAPELTAADVADASVIPSGNEGPLAGWAVRLELTKDGARRFEEYTGAHLKRRFAILVDGKVMSAPVIQTRIPGGIATITLGTGSPEEQKESATKLVKALMGE